MVAGERLLVLVRVKQDPRPQNGTIRPQHLPSVRIVIPAGISMTDRDTESVYVRPRLLHVQHGHADHIGTTCLYGYTGGVLYASGLAGERFAVRNSGAVAVVEGVGDHGCEYMTGGRVVILGSTGRNFAAGMSGGIAYIWDPQTVFPQLCNMEMVELEQMQADEDINELHQLISNHQRYTDSKVAAQLLNDWPAALTQFVKVMPTDYKRVLEERKQQVSAG